MRENNKFVYRNGDCPHCHSSEYTWWDWRGEKFRCTQCTRVYKMKINEVIGDIKK